MADDKKDANGGAATGAQGTPAVALTGTSTGKATPEMSMQLAGQYIKDLSFENPGIGQMVQNPQIDLNVDLQGRRINDQGQYEIVMKLRITATQDKKTIFLLELTYGGMFILHNVPDDSLQPILLIECPRLLFPFVRRIVADVVRDGGLPALMIDPIDFVALYRNKMNEMAPQQRVT